MKNLKIQSTLLIALSFVLGWSEFVVVGILDDIALNLKISITAVGILVTIFSIFYAIGTPIVTSFIKRDNLYQYLLVLMTLLILGNSLSAVSNSYWVLVIARILTAVASGSLISVDLTIASIIVPFDKKGTITAWIFSGFSIASVFGVPLSTLISSVTNWHASFLIINIITIFILLMLMRFLPHNFKETKQATKKSKSKGFFVEEIRLLKDPRILVGSLIPLFNWAGIYVVYTYMRPILSQWLKFSSLWVTLFFLLDGLTSLISNQLGGHLSDFSWMKFLPYLYAMEVAIMVSFPITLNNRVGGVIVLLAMSLIASLINSPIQLYLLGVAERNYPDSVVFASSLNSIFASLGVAVGSATGGMVIKYYQLPFTGIAGALFFFITLFLTILLKKIDRKQNKKF